MNKEEQYEAFNLGLLCGEAQYRISKLEQDEFSFIYTTTRAVIYNFEIIYNDTTFDEDIQLFIDGWNHAYDLLIGEA